MLKGIVSMAVIRMAPSSSCVRRVAINPIGRSLARCLTGAPDSHSGGGQEPVDLTNIPAIDTRAHPFPLEAERITADRLRDALSVSLRGRTSRLNETMLLCRVTIKELARLLGCEATWEAAI